MTITNIESFLKDYTLCYDFLIVLVAFSLKHPVYRYKITGSTPFGVKPQVVFELVKESREIDNKYSFLLPKEINKILSEINDVLNLVMEDETYQDYCDMTDVMREMAAIAQMPEYQRINVLNQYRLKAL